MQLEHILTSFDVKTGNGKFVVDFHISRGTLPCQCQNLWLLVARLDNMDTAACIASPPNVDFLINRRRVPKRTKNDMGRGPQLPSNITKIIKYGVNLLEVFGDFNGQYMIAVAFMKSISDPDPLQLQDYLHSMSDCEVIEVSSRISLNCPVSQRRIITPVKGHLCKHHQCFDYNYFLEVNSTRPIWKCPVCKKPVCNLDIRIDQNFLKILNEAANNVSDIIISYDGSWMVDMTEKSQTTETNRETKSKNNHVLDTIGNPISIKAEKCPSTSRQSHVTSAVSPLDFKDSCMQSQGSCDIVHTPPSVQQVRHQPNRVNTTQPFNSFTNPNHQSSQRQPEQGQTHGVTHADLGTGYSVNSLTAERPSTLRQSPVMCAVSPPDFRDSRMQSQGLCDVVHTPPPVQQTRNQPNPVNTTQPSYSFTNPNHQSAQSQSQQGQIHRATQADLGTGTTNKARRKTLFTPVKLTPCATSSLHSTVLDVEQLRKKVKRHYTACGQSHPAQAIASDTGTLSPIRLPEASGDAMPTSRMRGSLKGKKLEAARLEFFSLPCQPIRANEPWSILPRPKPTTNTTNPHEF